MNKDLGFRRVSFPEEIVRRLYDHEILLSFYDDEASLKFDEWWNEVGMYEFGAWLASQGLKNLLE